MAFSARRNLVRLQDKRAQVETDFAFAEEQPAKGHSFKLELLPVVNSFTKSLPLRRRSRLPFASMSTTSTVKPSRGEGLWAGHKDCILVGYSVNGTLLEPIMNHTSCPLHLSP